VDNAKTKKILEWMGRADQSELSVSDFFKNNKVPFSKAQYFIYKKRLAKEGVEGLRDRRKLGGHRKLSLEAEGFILGCVQSNPNVKLQWLQKGVRKNFRHKISVSSISRAIKRISKNKIFLPKGRPGSKAKPEAVIEAIGGFEIIIAIAFHLGWPERVAKLVSDEINELRNSERFGINDERKDMEGRKASGKFSRAYNQREDVRSTRFASISEKREMKNWQSMDIVRDKPEVLLRKSLSVLSLPIITMNGNVRSFNIALGNSLKHICGFNYKQSTIAKYLNELKYLGMSTRLLQDLPEFWRHCWADEITDSLGPVLCYYIDGNTKALWSSQRVKQNKVTMLGRVMGCLEQVFIHDCFGHPIYFETFSGHGPVGEHILGLFEKVGDTILDVPRSSAKVYRAIVMDSASNSVKTLRAFAAQNKYYYVTPLDDNQWNERGVRRYGRPSRYRYGDATLREIEKELEDSHDKRYLTVARAIKIDWDSGKTTVLLTSLPLEILDASEVVWSYFKRWPSQELQFRHKKAVVALNHVAGYGRKIVENPRVLEAQKKAAKRIEELTKDLAKPIEQVSIHAKEIDDLIQKERQIRSKSTIRNGQRILPTDFQQEFDGYGEKIRRHNREIKKIEKMHEKRFKMLRKHQKEWLRLQGKEKVYEVDVELDQIVTFHRICLANLMAYLIHYFFDGTPMSMETVLHQIIHLQGVIEETEYERRVTLKRNDKAPEMMRRLSTALKKLNGLNVQGPKGKTMRFALV